MDGVIHTTLLTSTLFLSSLFPQASPSATVTPFPTIGQESFRVVKEAETLTDIAKAEYKNPDKVSIILEDNPWIEDPNVIVPGWNIKIRKNPLLDIVDPSVHLATSSVEVKQEEVVEIDPTPEITPVVQSVAAFASVSAPAPSPIQQPQLTPTNGPLNEEQLTYVGNCEAGMIPTKNTGNGYYGSLQF